VTEPQLQRLFLDQFNMRIEKEMNAYILRKLADGDRAPFAVIGGDARTGVPMRLMIEPAQLAAQTSQSPQLIENLNRASISPTSTPL
jgi:hypothetical protein